MLYHVELRSRSVWECLTATPFKEKKEAEAHRQWAIKEFQWDSDHLRVAECTPRDECLRLIHEVVFGDRDLMCKMISDFLSELPDERLKEMARELNNL